MIEIRSVSAGYAGSTVLRDVTIAVPEGSVVALLGPNGAGKTTLLRVASGLLAPSSGQVLVDGTDLAGRKPHEFSRAGVCHVPEGRGVFRQLTVKENLELQATVGEEASAIDRAAEVFPVLGQRLSQQAGTLSGGEQQMLALARAYVASPKAVLLDEVSMGLAPRIVDQIFEFLRALAQAGVAMLLVEQYVERALALAEYVYLLDRGTVTFAGDRAELVNEDLFERYLGVSG
jgi:branched-chain amino acid transport system ATP-binding protein